MPATPEARRIGRILSLGFPMPGPRVDNYNFFGAPSLFDYDALVVDIDALASLMRSIIDGTEEVTTFAGAPVRAGSSLDGVPLEREIARRREETATLLDNGGAVVVFAQARADGAPDPYAWLPDEARALTQALVPADGTQAHVVDHQHPMAPFVLGQLANIGYRARIAADEAPALKRGIFARSYGGAAIAASAAAGNGTVVFMPALKTIPSGQGRYAVSDALQSCVRRALGVMAEGRAPGWITKHEIPGLEERSSALKDAERRVAAAESDVENARAAHDELAKYHALLWQEGALGLEPAVIDALRALGLDGHAARPEEIELRAEGARVFVEIDAANEAAGMAAHYRLRQRIEREIERSGFAPRGLVFVNGYRLTAPAQRPQQASAALVAAATTMRYAVATTSSLFEAVTASLRGDSEAVSSYIHRLVSVDGYLA